VVRPRKPRLVSYQPPVRYFEPRGWTRAAQTAVSLTLDELEALRLTDLAGLGQGQCAQQMGISQSTVQRILGSARRKVADALVHGKGIHIEGGEFAYPFPLLLLHCHTCGASWSESLLVPEGPYSCFYCGSDLVEPLRDDDGGTAHLQQCLERLTWDIRALQERLDVVERQRRARGRHHE